LIDQNSQSLGIVSIEQAILKAKDAMLDLVEISGDSDPPVCKILDYGKLRYEKQKQKKINKKKQHVIQLKEIRLRPNTDDHDLLTKVKRGYKFLESGAKLKVTVMFRGREMARQQSGVDLLNRVVQILEDIGEIDKKADLEGRRMSIILSPK
tara:strand:- start:3080 stop:3535 length:456 start_codon:yes stop_codon:yes gene_type:complete